MYNAEHYSAAFWQYYIIHLMVCIVVSYLNHTKDFSQPLSSHKLPLAFFMFLCIMVIVRAYRKAGMFMNIYDIAEKCGVSIATVSRVLNNNPSVRAQTRERVLEVMRQEGYTPNAMARGLGLGRNDGHLFPKERVE